MKPWEKYNECPTTCGWLQSGYCPANIIINHNGKCEIYPKDDAPSECINELTKINNIRYESEKV